MIILSKLGKDYFTPKGYRLITLLNTIGKVIEFIIAKRITYLIKTYKLILNIYIGGRRLRLYEYNIYYLIERIY